MSDIANIRLPDDNTYSIKDTLSRSHLFYSVVGTQTSQTSSWTGELDIDNLYDGLSIAYYIPTESSSNVTLNLTLNSGQTGPINVYYSGSRRMGDDYTPGCCIILTYWSAGSISISGQITTDDRWIHSGEIGNSIQLQVSKQQIGSARFTGVSTYSDEITNWSPGSMPTYTVMDNGLLVISSGTVPTLQHTQNSIPNITILDVDVVTDVTEQ